MVAKYIFLDIDGVLNSYRSDIALHGANSNPDMVAMMFNHIDPKLDVVAVNMVRRLVEATNAEVVMSTSWRVMNPIEHFHVTFGYYHWDTSKIIIDSTPCLGTKRGVEIQTWLSSVQGEYKYCILDDAALTDFLTEQGPHIVRTDPAVGISIADFHAALNILS